MTGEGEAAADREDRSQGAQRQQTSIPKENRSLPKQRGD